MQEVKILPTLLFASLVALLALTVACKTASEVTFVNPHEVPLLVQIGERAPFEVPAQKSVTARLPAIERLHPVSITARDPAGAVVFFLTTSVHRIEVTGNRVVLEITGRPSDPLLQYR